MISAKDKNVVVIGGGDTGMDCVSNAMREGAKQVKLLDVYPPVPESGRYANTPWPEQPRRLKTTYALDEGGQREFGREVIGLEGDRRPRVRALARKVTGDSSRTLVAIPDSEFSEPAELVLVAIGFTNPEHEGLITELGVSLDSYGNVKAGTFKTSVEGVYAGRRRHGSAPHWWSPRSPRVAAAPASSIARCAPATRSRLAPHPPLTTHPP